MTAFLRLRLKDKNAAITQKISGLWMWHLPVTWTSKTLKFIGHFDFLSVRTDSFGKLCECFLFCIKGIKAKMKHAAEKFSTVIKYKMRWISSVHLLLLQQWCQWRRSWYDDLLTSVLGPGAPSSVEWSLVVPCHTSDSNLRKRWTWNSVVGRKNQVRN